ncbi:nicotinate-nucleotide adenylyltransferase [Ferrovibrio sp.]|uniref:nicotinate-nucleotide adenylyltransferase n=1 Tax=Ferrovibrio sp. TaxID=1917215 RepID=UPI0035B08868
MKYDAQAFPLPPGFHGRLRIGLLGGSFNPAHAAHREISLIALHRLKLDAVWWLVSPQNPLKSATGMAALSARLQSARDISAHPRIMPCTFESAIGTRYSADTARALRKLYPRMRFVWLLGADNLAQLRYWKDWRGFAAAMPLCVLDRPGYTGKAAASLAAHALQPHRLAMSDAAALPDRAAPALLRLQSKLNPLSATLIRAAQPAKASIAAFGRRSITRK